MKVKLTINPDEFSQDPFIAIPQIHELGINNLELRTINGKNVISLDVNEARELKRILQKNNLKVSAIASPLFKWYYYKDSPHLKFDQYHESPLKSRGQQKKSIINAFEIAEIFESRVVRIFSYMNDPRIDVDFLKVDEVFNFAVKEARNRGIKISLENEPICNIKTLEDLEGFKDLYSDGLGLWFDISNFYFVGEKLTKEKIAQFKQVINYVQFKDYLTDPDFHYVRLLNGQINYKMILGWLKELYPDDKEILVNVETHIEKNKYKEITGSIENLKNLFDTLDISYS